MKAPGGSAGDAPASRLDPAGAFKISIQSARDLKMKMAADTTQPIVVKSLLEISMEVGYGQRRWLGTVEEKVLH